MPWLGQVGMSANLGQVIWQVIRQVGISANLGQVIRVGQPWAGYSCRPTLGRLLTLSVSFAFDDLQSTFAESNSKLSGV